MRNRKTSPRHADLIRLAGLAQEIADGFRDADGLFLNPQRWQRWQETRDAFLKHLGRCQTAPGSARPHLDLLRLAADPLQLKAIKTAFELVELRRAAVVGRFENAAESLVTFVRPKAVVASRVRADVRLTSSPVDKTSASDRADPKRLTIHLESQAVALDGKQYSSLDPVALRFLQAIHGASRPISGRELERLPGCKGKRVDRCLKKLPAALQQIVRGETGKGYWIELPPHPSA